MLVPPPTIETRLCTLRAQIAALRAVAQLVPAAAPLPGCTPGESAHAFPAWTVLMADALDEQIRAICAALPEPVVNLDAPLAGGAR